MAYIVVEWADDGALSVVKHDWLTPLKKEAFWPPCKEQKQFTKLLKDHDSHIDESWKLHQVKRCMFTTDDLDKALKKCKEAEDTSNLDSDDSKLNKEKRKLKTRVIYSSSDSVNSYLDENLDQPVKKKLTIRPPPRPPRFVTTSIPDDNILTTSSGSIKLPLFASKFSKEIATPRATSPVVLTQNISESAFASNSFESSGPSRNIPRDAQNYNNTEYDHKVLRLLYEIREQNDQILKHLNKNVAISNKEINLPVQFPLDRLESLNELENHLKSDQNLTLMVNYLSTFGGKDCTAVTNRILKHVLKDELAALYSYKGKKLKHIFCDLLLNEAIIRAVKKTVNCTTAEVEQTLKVWLKHAPQRALKRNQNH